MNEWPSYGQKRRRGGPFVSRRNGGAFPRRAPSVSPTRDALEGRGPQRQPQRRLGRRLEEVAKAVGGGYCRLQMPLKPALGVRGTVAGHRLGALEGGRGGALPLPMHPSAPPTAHRQGTRARAPGPRTRAYDHERGLLGDPRGLLCPGGAGGRGGARGGRGVAVAHVEGGADRLMGVQALRCAAERGVGAGGARVAGLRGEWPRGSESRGKGGVLRVPRGESLHCARTSRALRATARVGPPSRTPRHNPSKCPQI